MQNYYIKLLRHIESELDEIRSYFAGRNEATSTAKTANDEVAFYYYYNDEGKLNVVLKKDNEMGVQAIREEENLPTLKEGSITKRKDGIWHGKYYDNGQRVSVYATTKKGLIIKMNKAIVERDKLDRQVLATKKTSLAKWIEKFMELKAPKLKPSSMQDYEWYLINKVAKSPLGKKKLAYITAQDIEKLLNKITAPSAQARTYRDLKSCFSTAVKYKIISESPFDLVENIPEPKNKRHIPSEKEFNKLCDFLKENNFDMYLFVKFISFTGLRKGEALALRWSDITDFIKINKAYSGAANAVLTPKTKAAYRNVPLFEQTKNILSQIKHTGDEVFSMIYKNAVTKRLRIYCKKLNIKVTIHSLRHMFATDCLEAGIEPKLVQMWLGHENYYTTINTYSHINKDFENSEIEKMSKFREKKGK